MPGLILTGISPAGDRTERAGSGRAVHSVTPDVRRTSALSTEKRLAAQRLTRGVMDRLYQLQKLGLGYLTLGQNNANTLRRGTPAIASCHSA